jgi:Fic family protein
VPGDPVIHLLNRQLRGTPYTIPDNEVAETLVREAFDLGQNIDVRRQIVAESFARQSREIRDRIERMTQARIVYESNALESAGKPLDDTDKVIADAGMDLTTLGEHLAKLALGGDAHLLEVIGLHRATLFAKQLAADFRNEGKPLLEIDIRGLHHETVSNERFAGSYREHEAGISGSDLKTADPGDVPFQMRQLVDWVNASDALPPLAAAAAHSWLVNIHPFQDGNGRVARLLANVVLLNAGWPPLIIRSADREQYLEALSLSDEGGDLFPLFDLFLSSIERTLGDLERPALAQELYVADLKRNPNHRYEVWRSQLDAFLDHVWGALRAAGWQIFRAGVPEPSTLLLLERRDKTGNMWLARLHGPSGQTVVLRLGPMSNALEAATNFETVWPSLKVAIRDDQPNAPHGYRDVAPSELAGISEVIVRTPVVDQCVTIGRSNEPEELTPDDAARALGDALAALSV